MQLDISKNKAYTFLLPMLYGLEDAKLATNNYKDIDNVYIDSDYTIHCTNTSFKVIYSLKFDVNYIEQYKLFIEGKYSKFSPYFKLLILKFWLCDDMLKSILFKGKISTKYWLEKGINLELHTEDCEHWTKPIFAKEHINYLKLYTI